MHDTSGGPGPDPSGADASSGAAERPPRVPEAALLADALGREGRLISREAAGVGAIAGF
ncbi:MAG: hypothetical protein GXX90_01240, partial [Microbacteriaceae bacterium]|nr:hypothetical protein [Microbacteriaceae bacterium]